MTAWGMGGRTRRPERTAGLGPDRVKTQTSGRLFMNFSRFSAFSAITGPAERKNSLQMRRFQTISEFSHGLGREEPRCERRVTPSPCLRGEGLSSSRLEAFRGKDQKRA